MASFKNRGTKKKPSWQYCVSNKGKLIRKGGFRTKQEAQIAAAEVEAELLKGVVPRLDKVPIDSYFDNWIKVFKSDVSSNTLARYSDSLNTVKNYFGSKPIQQITKVEYQTFLNEYQKDGDKAKTSVRKLNQHIRSCVKEAIDEGIIRVDFTRGAKFPGREAKRGEEKHLDQFEAKKLLNYLINKKEKTTMDYLILLGLSSGMRFGELVGLTRKDFDFKQNIININKTWGYNNKMHQGFGPTKNPQSVRKIKINKQVMTIFKDMFKITPDNINRLVFFSPKSKYKVVSNTGTGKKLKSICKELKINEITTHGLRHTKASVMLYRGVSVYYVAEYLGHADVETTNRNYAHIIKELREKDEEIMLQEII